MCVHKSVGCCESVEKWVKLAGAAGGEAVLAASWWSQLKRLPKTAAKFQFAIFGKPKTCWLLLLHGKTWFSWSVRWAQFWSNSLCPSTPLFPLSQLWLNWDTQNVGNFWLARKTFNFSFKLRVGCILNSNAIRIWTPLGDCVVVCAKCALNVCLIAEKAFKSRILSAHAVQLCGPRRERETETERLLL